MEECKKNIVITSGGFDPVHVGHIEYLKRAKFLLPDTNLVCIVNTDNFLLNKKGYCFMCEQDRIEILSNFWFIDEIFKSIDEDMTVCKSIEAIFEKYKGNNIVFAKGGDRTKDEIPEASICNKLGIKIVDGLGEKIRSSSELVKEGWKF